MLYGVCKTCSHLQLQSSVWSIEVFVVLRARMIVKNVYADEECAHHKSICGVNACMVLRVCIA